MNPEAHLVQAFGPAPRHLAQLSSSHSNWLALEEDLEVKIYWNIR